MSLFLRKPNIEGIIRTLVCGRRQSKRPISQKDIMSVCHMVRSVFLQEAMCLRVNAPICIVGDLHGQFEDLLRILNTSGHPPQQSYLFLGDYVDRGHRSVETITLLFCYKICYPDKIFLLRGNHESEVLNQVYGFFDECKRRYTVKLWKTFVDCYNCMPVAAIVSKRVFCCHGGLSPHLSCIEQINQLKRPTEIPSEGLLCDLLWSDPHHTAYGWAPNKRGVSVSFGRDTIERFLVRNDFDLICRAHQVVEDGYEFFAKRQLVTVFSAPNYCGIFENSGATMKISENLTITFDIYPAKNSTPHTSTLIRLGPRESGKVFRAAMRIKNAIKPPRFQRSSEY
ncbi:serine/threonine-protein phosphatase PP1-like [Drosophila pseudoobscura]|uniref:Serine/threonine-protein phosphatase n=1 Tax=Drosophila pseudoobscura pseudoobscura TaxID=46245 RepID=A0A6I8V508_DROPS|nr:serine/threonine-protein phosphatase PP1 [Drosophila pseudoobscura]